MIMDVLLGTVLIAVIAFVVIWAYEMRRLLDEERKARASQVNTLAKDLVRLEDKIDDTPGGGFRCFGDR